MKALSSIFLFSSLSFGAAVQLAESQTEFTPLPGQIIETGSMLQKIPDKLSENQKSQLEALDIAAYKSLLEQIYDHMRANSKQMKGIFSIYRFCQRSNHTVFQTLIATWLEQNHLNKADFATICACNIFDKRNPREIHWDSICHELNRSRSGQKSMKTRALHEIISDAERIASKTESNNRELIDEIANLMATCKSSGHTIFKAEIDRYWAEKKPYKQLPDNYCICYVLLTAGPSNRLKTNSSSKSSSEAKQNKASTSSSTTKKNKCPNKCIIL